MPYEKWYRVPSSETPMSRVFVVRRFLVRVTGFDVGSFCIHAPDRAIAKCKSRVSSCVVVLCPTATRRSQPMVLIRHRRHRTRTGVHMGRRAHRGTVITHPHPTFLLPIEHRHSPRAGDLGGAADAGGLHSDVRPPRGKRDPR